MACHRVLVACIHDDVAAWEMKPTTNDWHCEKCSQNV